VVLAAERCLLLTLHGFACHGEWASGRVGGCSCVWGVLKRISSWDTLNSDCDTNGAESGRIEPMSDSSDGLSLATTVEKIRHAMRAIRWTVQEESGQAMEGRTRRGMLLKLRLRLRLTDGSEVLVELTSLSEEQAADEGFMTNIRKFV